SSPTRRATAPPGTRTRTESSFAVALPRLRSRSQDAPGDLRHVAGDLAVHFTPVTVGIEQDRRQTRGARAEHVGSVHVSHVKCPPGIGTALGERGAEDARVGLLETDHV